MKIRTTVPTDEEIQKRHNIDLKRIQRQSQSYQEAMQTVERIRWMDMRIRDLESSAPTPQSEAER